MFEAKAKDQGHNAQDIKKGLCSNDSKFFAKLQAFYEKEKKDLRAKTQKIDANFQAEKKGHDPCPFLTNQKNGTVIDRGQVIFEDLLALRPKPRT